MYINNRLTELKIIIKPPKLYNKNIQLQPKISYSSTDADWNEPNVAAIFLHFSFFAYFCPGSYLHAIYIPYVHDWPTMSSSSVTSVATCIVAGCPSAPIRRGWYCAVHNNTLKNAVCNTINHRFLIFKFNLF